MTESLRRRADRFGLDLIFVDVWEGTDAEKEAAEYRERWDLQGTVLLDESATLARALGVRGVPTNVFVDENGTVRAVGASTGAELVREAVALEPRLREVAAELLGESAIPGEFLADA